MNILFLYQNVVSGSNISTDNLLRQYRKQYPDDRCTVYKQTPNAYRGPLAYLVNLIWSVFDYFRIISRQKNQDAVYTTYFTAGIAHFLTPNRRIPLIFHVHGDQAFGSVALKSPLRRIYRAFVSRMVTAVQTFSLRHAKVVCFVSRLAMREFLRNYTLNDLEGKATIIHNGVDSLEYRSVSEAEKVRLKRIHRLPFRHVVTYVGRIDKKKGIDILIRAMRLYADPQTCCLILHPKPDDEYALAYYRELHGIAGTAGTKIFFIENPVRLAPYYALSDCVVLPSEQEMAPMVLLEALAAGTPVITTKVGGTSEMLSGMPEYIYLKRREPIELSRRITHIMGLPRGTRDRLRERGRRIASRFGWDTSAGELHRTLHGLIRS
jgi:glycosyltransferase involved in cell wall biosynthesis